MKMNILDLICFLLTHYRTVFASIKMTVSPPGPVEVNQTVTLQCSFEENPIAAFFFSTAKNIHSTFCDLSDYTSGVQCKASLCAVTYNTTCLNHTIFIVQYPVPLSWNGTKIHCRGLLSDEKSNEVTLTVQVSVTSVTLTPTQISIDVGEQLSLTCQTDYCSPAANITWYKSSDDVIYQTTSTTDANSYRLMKTTSTLQYVGVAADNGRFVYCTANNRPGQNVVSNKYKLDVKYPPSSQPVITASPPGFQYESGVNITLTCVLSGGNPVASLSWSCINTEMVGNNQSNFTSAVSELLLMVNSSYNNQQCSCTARHRLFRSSRSNTISLTVFYNNVITTKWSDVYAVSEHGRLTLRCLVEGNPLSNIIWIFVKNYTVIKRENNVQNSSLDISSANCLDHGKYKVIADNGKGPYVWQTTTVTVTCKPRLYRRHSLIIETLSIKNNDPIRIFVRIILYPPATLTKWIFSREANESILIINNTNGFRMIDVQNENEQNITLWKKNLNIEEYGNYTLIVQNNVGTFTRTVSVQPLALSKTSNSHIIEIMAGVVGVMMFTILFTILVVFVWRQYTCSCLIKLESRNKLKDIKMDAVSENKSDNKNKGQHTLKETSFYQEITGTRDENEYEKLGDKENLEYICKPQVYESLKETTDDNKYEKLPKIVK